jgi:pantetheine-phosphate adenylyltransferase
MARLACEDLLNVTVISSTARLIDLVDELGADVIVKGVRNESDYLYEQQHALYNRAHNPKAETLYLPADPAFDHISSTLVRARMTAGACIDDIVPPAVAAYLEGKKGDC